MSKEKYPSVAGQQEWGSVDHIPLSPIEKTSADISTNQSWLDSELFKLSREAIFVLDLEGKILFLNRAAEKLYGWSAAEASGAFPVELLKTRLPRPLAQIETILRQEGVWEHELIQTTRDGTNLTVASRWALRRDDSGQYLGRLQLDTDITKRKHAEHALRRLSGRLLNLRDEERRRLARDLHDSVGQQLAGVKMHLSVAETQLQDSKLETLKLISESCNLVDQAMREIRTISYLLHPPLLDEVGLSSALSWYISGFAERSRLKVDVDIPKDVERFPRELEIAIFRIVQECLTNVHRHSGSSTAKVRLSRVNQQLRLKIEDQGRGMDEPVGEGENVSHHRIGVGISGIRERVQQLGGQMQIRTGSSGTTVEVLFLLEGHPSSAPPS
ncbi:MAG TPA: histidine kinase [Candidatus Dormibacteraeota bacterium]|nr:histidine kinase [Candidatus Dormibacteraeota bacterium]